MKGVVSTREELLALCSAKDAELNQEHGVQVYALRNPCHTQVSPFSSNSTSQWARLSFQVFAGY